ncbi:MAG TPA: HlyD family efflux transporter periplasmic adaptor subunit [Candidatus Sulfotelmatobacter sp.]|nr:HlyD family efflux transporter periplasmic adaptor subunit [Candidatus Sulfotelmatobacter sp.]
MNIANALNAALPELPERVLKRSVPKLDPRVIAKEQLEKSQRTVLAKLPGADNFIRLEPAQWVLLQLFDGERSYGEISSQVSDQTGIFYSEDAVREFAAFIQANTDLFYKSPLERNITLQQKLRGQRLKRKRFKVGDFSDITIAEWPQADDFVARIYPYLSWVYTWWFTLLALAMFAVMAWMWAGRFGEIWHDSFEFYNFTTKSARDLLEFWVLFGAMAFFHESFHGLTCKHFGGNVEKMGFSLMYFAPSFFCDVTQIWIYGGKWERIATVIAGIWGDLIVCFLSTAVWWGTAPGMVIHNLAYKVMMVTGIGVSLLNLNPLIKLDGYYIFCELIGEPDFKERTSAYLSGWTRKHLFGMPAEVEYVPLRRRPFYLVYAILSAIYGYLLLSFLMAFSYNILHSYSPAWAFAPAALAGYWVFRARIHSFGRFTKLLYLDKKERVLGGMTPLRILGFGASALLLLFLPIWPDFQDGSFVLEPAKQAVVHASVRGRVVQVFVDEGQRVVAGQLLASLANLDLESDLARAQADLRVATARATQSQLRYGDVGTAEQERIRLLQQNHSLSEEVAKLQLLSPIAGVVATPRLHDLSGTYLDEGAPVVELIDDSALRARVYVPEFAMHDLHLGAPVRLHVQSRLRPVAGVLHSISADWVPLDPSLAEKEQLTGINPPRFYLAEAWLDRAGDLLPGMTGIAKIQVGRRSLAGLGLRFVRDLVARRVW